MNINKSNQNKKIIYVLIALSTLPLFSLLFLSSELENIISKFASVTGFVGGVLLLWQFIFGIRGVIKNITPDYDWAIKIHSFMGVFGCLFVFSHPVLISLSYNQSLTYIFDIDFSNNFSTFVSFGRIALVLYLFVWITSSIFRKLISYRNWLYIHYLSYPMLFFVIIHPYQIGTILNSNTIIQYYWFFLTLVATVSIVIKIKDILNIGWYRVKLLENIKLPGEIYLLKYKFQTLPNLIPGQYFYIKNKYIGEAHPFSVLDWDETDETITFGIKALGKYTRELENSKVGEIHYLDGAFGQFTIEGQSTEGTKVILAGGIGITPFYRLVLDFNNPKTYLFYANMKIDYALYRDKFKKLLGKNYYDFISHEKIQGDNIVCDIISSNNIKNILKDRNVSTIKFFICGSPGFTKAMINCLKELGVSREMIFIEEFEY